MENITYNQIIQEFQNLANAHLQVQTFTQGDIFEVDANTVVFPQVHLITEQAIIKPQEITYNFKLIAMDLVEPAEENEGCTWAIEGIDMSTSRKHDISPAYVSALKSEIGLGNRAIKTLDRQPPFHTPRMCDCSVRTHLNRLRSSRRIIFPLSVLGNSGTNSISLG